MAESSRSQRWVRWAGHALIIGIALTVLRPFLTAVGWAAILAFATWPVFQRVGRGLGGRTRLAAVVMIVLVLLVVLIPAMLLSVALAAEIRRTFAELKLAAPAVPARVGAGVREIPWVGAALADRDSERHRQRRAQRARRRPGAPDALLPLPARRRPRPADPARPRPRGRRADGRDLPAPRRDRARGHVRHAAHRTRAGPPVDGRLLGGRPPLAGPARGAQCAPGAHAPRRRAGLRSGRRLAPPPGPGGTGHLPAGVGPVRREPHRQPDPLLVPRRRPPATVPARLLRRPGRGGGARSDRAFRRADRGRDAPRPLARVGR